MMRLLHVLSFLLLSFGGVTVNSNPSVIIVGAGPAGIAAATKLLENSVTNITILEAENRIGGRIYSVKFGDEYVDVGAQYCHGEKGNTVYELVKDLDILQHPNLSYRDRTRIYNSKGLAIDSDLADDFCTSIQTYDEEINTTSTVTLGAGFLEKYKSTILRKYSDDDRKLAVAIDGIKMIQDIVLMHEGAFSWFLPAAGRHYDVCEGDQIMTWKTRGYHIILDVLMHSYPNPDKKLPIDDKIILNKKVDKIVWNGNKVNVHTADKYQYTADHVIFTPSIGVLKENDDQLFEPSLPQEKKDALRALGFDGVMKVILHFPIKWWTDKDSAFFFLWNKDDLIKVKNESIDGPKKDGIPWVIHVPTVVKMASNPNVLIAWVSGDLVPEIEKTPEDVVLKGVMYVIKKFLAKDYNVTEPDKIIRSQWITNPNFRGTYSYEKFGYFEEDVSYQAKLREPLTDNENIPVLLFAGEATDSTHYSTVHGAIDSGKREAERIINLYK